VLGVQIPLLIVHLKMLLPVDKPVIVVLGLALLVKVAEPEITDQSPVPEEGVLA
jgi:hypothetical protein